MSLKSASLDAPLTKRKRCEEDDSDPVVKEASVEHRFWFEDGNIILQARHTKFRIHRGVLSNHSGFFKDLFALPQPGGDIVTEGCQFVQMAEDNPEDWVNVLGVIYNPLKIHRSSNDYEIPLLMSLLRLGHKYQFDHFRDAAVEGLKLYVPSKLIELDPPLFEDIKGHEFDLVNLAMEVGLRSTLPVALYLCLTQQNLSAIFNGITREDGSLSTLPSDCQTVLALAKDKIIQATTEKAWLFLRGDSALPCRKCEAKVTCTIERMKLFGESMILLAGNPGQCLTGELLDHDLCRPCTNTYHYLHQIGRQDVWNALPSFFGLPKWNDLKDFEM